MPSDSQPDGGLVVLAEAFRSRRTGLLVLGEEPEALRVRLEGGQIVALGPASEPRPAPLPKPNDSVRLRLERVLSEIGMRRPVAGDPPPFPPQGSLRDRLIERLAGRTDPVRFEEGEAAPPGLVDVAVATEPLILEAVRQMRPDEAVREVLGDLDRRLVATPALADERTLTLTEGYLLSRIDGLVSAREVLQLVPLDPQETERSLLGLVLTGRVECRSAPPPATAAEPAPAVANGPAAPAETEAPAEPPTPEPSHIEASLDIEAADAPAGAAAPIEDEIIEATTEEVGEAAAEQPLVEAIPDDEAETAAYPAVVLPAAARASEPMDPAVAERRRDIVALYQSLPFKQTHFEMLGVEPGCNDDEVKRAYVTLTKRYHPDVNRDKRLDDLHDMLEAIIIRVGEAWEVIGEAKSRASYESRAGIVRRPRPAAPAAAAPTVSSASSAPPATAPAPTPYPAPDEPGEYVSPEEILQRARRLLAQARYWDAIQILEMALPGMEPPRQQHRGRLLLARAYSKNPNWLRRAEEMLHELIRQDPTNADTHYELGLVYKTGGFVARAQGMFRRALELRPGHKEAAAELGIQTEEPAGGGLLKRLFKRGKAS